jgi:hypothetical protein
MMRGKPLDVKQIEIIDQEHAVLLRTNGGLITSYDSGNSWRVSTVGGNVMDGLDEMVVSTGDPCTIYISNQEPLSRASMSNLYVSKDCGRHFTKVFEVP